MLVCAATKGEKREKRERKEEKKRVERGKRKRRDVRGTHENVEKAGRMRRKGEAKETKKKKTKMFAQPNSGDGAIASCAIDFRPVREERYRWPKAITLYELDTGLASASAPATIPSLLSHPSVFLVTSFFSAFALLENRAVFAN